MRLRGVWANVPPRRPRRDPIFFGPYLYSHGDQIERCFKRMKRCRRIATRHEKRAANFLAVVKLAAIRLWLRVDESKAHQWYPVF